MTKTVGWGRAGMLGVRWRWLRYPGRQLGGSEVGGQDWVGMPGAVLLLREEGLQLLQLLPLSPAPSLACVF